MTAQQPDPQPGVYRLDADASTISFQTRAMFGLSTVKGSFSVSEGEITVDSDVSRSTVDVVIRADSFDSGDHKRDEHIRSAAYLDASGHPEIVFRGDGAVRSGTQGSVSGVLTVQGRSRPTVLTVSSWATDGERLTVRASAVVDRYDFGITKAKGLAGRRLTVDLDVVAVR
jgi:polyisoprenoid-binding protein YceI